MGMKLFTYKFSYMWFKAAVTLTILVSIEFGLYSCQHHETVPATKIVGVV